MLFLPGFFLFSYYYKVFMRRSRQIKAEKLKILQSAEVTRLAHDGRGVAKVDGKTVFITGALPGEEVTFHYTQRQSQFDQGQVVEIVKPSSERQTPLCIHADICGGCRLQHLTTAAQLFYKQQTLLDQLWHFGKVAPPTELLPPLAANEWGYRRKARLSVRYVNKKERLLIGFHEKQGRYVADLNVCEVLHPAVGKRLVELQTVLSQLSIYRAIPQIEVAVGDGPVVVLVLRHLEPLTLEDKRLLQTFGQEHGFTWYLQPGNASTVEPLDQPVTLHYQLPVFNLSLEFSPLDFVQINANINQQLVQLALNLLEVKSTDRVLDLFCGLGNFSLPLAQQAAELVGVEGDLQMVKRAQMNAERNQISNTHFYAADLSQDVTQTPWWRQKYNKLLLDPARTGALEIVQQMDSLGVERIVYVSCNPATFARDAAELVHKQGYELQQLGILDMFPHTHHVEAIGLFVKK